MFYIVLFCQRPTILPSLYLKKTHQIFSCQVIALYPGKEVKKGLESLYKKVERHLSEEEGLTQVVWRAMQEEFISQYKNVEDLIRRCYPGAQITLEFTIDEVLQYFSDIARSH